MCVADEVHWPGDERAVADADDDEDRSTGVTGDDQIEDAIVVPVGGEQAARVDDSVVGDVGTNETSVATAQKNRERIVVRIGGCEIGDAVPVEVARDES
jgi:hypothetical protein